MEKMAKGAKCVDLEMTKEKENIVDISVRRLKAEEIYGYITQGQENINLFWASAGSHFSRGNAERRFRDQEAVEEFFKCLLSAGQGKGYVEEQVFYADEAGLFSK